MRRRRDSSKTRQTIRDCSQRESSSSASNGEHGEPRGTRRGIVWHGGNAAVRVLCWRESQLYNNLCFHLSDVCFWLPARRAATHRGDGAVVAVLVVDDEADDDDDDDDGAGDN